jgi:lambda family phage portal protein
MAQLQAVLDSRGAPIAPEAIQRVRETAARLGPRGIRASLEGSAPAFFPYDSAQWYSPEMGDWLPWIRSPDTEINLYRDRMVARNRDLERNDGWAAGALNTILDSVIGGDYTLVAEPDYQALALYNPAFDDRWAEAYQDVVEALWRGYANDIGHYNDLAQQASVTQNFRLNLRHKLLDGEGLQLTYWLPELMGAGAAQFATCFTVIDPDRLSNPYQMVDTKYLRGGVEINDHGVPLAYHIREAHQNDWYNAVESMTWDRVVRQDDDGFIRVLHDFDRGRAGQHRGVSVFTPILSRLKMLATYYGVELQAATVASVFGTFITSPLDQQMIEEALSDGRKDNGLGAYQEIREEFHKKNTLMLNRVRVPTLAPGEDIKTVSSERPNDAFSPFTHEMLRAVAAALNVSGEQITKDYSEANYSSLRVGVVEAEKTFERRTSDFETNTANPTYAIWLQEAFERPEVREIMPRRSPSFLEARNAYARCYWLGAARGWVDPVAERQGEILGLDAGFSNLERVCAKQGMNWKVNLRKRARERRMMDELGLPHPVWMGDKLTATQEIVKSKPA